MLDSKTGMSTHRGPTCGGSTRMRRKYHHIEQPAAVFRYSTRESPLRPDQGYDKTIIVPTMCAKLTGKSAYAVSLTQFPGTHVQGEGYVHVMLRQVRAADAVQSTGQGVASVRPEQQKRGLPLQESTTT